MIEKLATVYPVQLICTVLDFPRSSYYYQPHPRDDEALKVALQRAAEEWPTYGYRRLTVQVRRDDQRFGPGCAGEAGIDVVHRVN